MWHGPLVWEWPRSHLDDAQGDLRLRDMVVSLAQHVFESPRDAVIAMDSSCSFTVEPAVAGRALDVAAVMQDATQALHRSSGDVAIPLRSRIIAPSVSTDTAWLRLRTAQSMLHRELVIRIPGSAEEAAAESRASVAIAVSPRDLCRLVFGYHGIDMDRISEPIHVTHLLAKILAIDSPRAWTDAWLAMIRSRLSSMNDYPTLDTNAEPPLLLRFRGDIGIPILRDQLHHAIVSAITSSTPPFVIDLPVEDRAAFTPDSTIAMSAVAVGRVVIPASLPSTSSTLHNIALAAHKLNRIAIAPGETFSFLQALGPITKEAGFQEGAAIVNQERTTMIGGGICDVSTAIFRAALFAGLPILQRESHSLLLTHYLQHGLPDRDSFGTDAAVVVTPSAVLDMQFANPTPNWIILEVAMEYVSSENAYVVTATLHTAPLSWMVSLSVDPPMYRCVQNGSDLSQQPDADVIVTVRRFIIASDGTTTTDVFRSVYRDPHHCAPDDSDATASERLYAWSL